MARAQTLLLGASLGLPALQAFADPAAPVVEGVQSPAWVEHDAASSPLPAF